MDGTELKEGSQYTKAEGSVIVTLLPDYIDSLAAGEHTLTTTFDDGTGEAKFIVAEAAAPAIAEVAITFNANGGSGSMDKVTTTAGGGTTTTSGKTLPTAKTGDSSLSPLLVGIVAAVGVVAALVGIRGRRQHD